MRFKVFCALLALVMSSCCMVYVVNFDDSPPAIVIPPDSDLVSMTASRPESGTPGDYDAKQNLYVSAGQLQQAGSFNAVASGSSKSMGIEQQVLSSRTVVGEDVFKQSASFSSLVKFGQQRFVYQGNYLLRNHSKVNRIDNIEWQNTASRITRESFLEMFGYIPTSLSAYVLNDKTITDAQFVEEKDGLFTFQYTLDTTIAPYYLLYEMRTSAGTKAFPEFLKAQLLVTMDSNWQVVSITTDCQYKVAMLGGITCTESLTETFSDIGEVNQLPHFEFFEQYFDAEIEQPDTNPDAVTVLTQMFNPYLTENKPLDISLKLSNADTIIEGNARALLDMNNLADTTVYLSALGIDAMYSDNRLLVQKGDVKASATVDGLMQAVSVFTGGSLPDIQLPALEDLLGEITAQYTDGEVTVSLHIALQGLEANIAIQGVLEGDSYSFVSAAATLGDWKLEIVPDSWNVPEFTGDYPDISGLIDIFADGKVALEVGGSIDAYIGLDITKQQAHLVWNDLYVMYNDETLLAKYGNITGKLAIADIGSVLQCLEGMVELPALPELGEFNLNVSFEAQEDGSLKIAVSDIATVTLNNVNNVWMLGEINVNAMGMQLTARLTDWQEHQAEFDNAIDLAEVVEKFAPYIGELLNANGYDVDISAKLTLNGTEYLVNANILFANAIEVEFELSTANSKLLNGNIKIVDNTLYLDIAGIKTAVSLNGNVDGSVFEQFKGINEQIDEILDWATGLSLSDIDILALIEQVAFADGQLTVTVNGSQLGLNTFDVTLNASDSMEAAISDVEVKGVALSVGATVRSTEEQVVIDGEYLTDIQVTIDELNTLYLQLDGLNGVLRFKMGTDNVLSGEYDFNSQTFRFNYDTVYAEGNIAQIEQVVTRLGEILGNNDPIGNAFSLSISDILNGMTIQTGQDGMTVRLSLGNIGLSVDITTGITSTFTATIDILGKSITARPCEQQVYMQFDDNMSYVDIGLVFDDFLPVFEQLFVARSWAFTIDGELALSDGSRYRLTNSTAQFSAENGYSFVANLNIEKFDGATFQPFKTVNFHYVDERFYIDYNGLKVTFTLQSLKDTLSLKDELFRVVPQLEQLVNDLLSAKDEASKPIDFSTIILNLAYTDGVFDIVLNGGVVMSGLGEVALTVSADPDLTLNVKNLSYDGMTVNGIASVKVAETEITAPDIAQYIDFDSIYHLLSAFVVTADNNSFHIEGNIRAKLVVEIDLFIAVYVDIDEEGFVNVAVLLEREKLGQLDFSGAAFNDYGGYSYLYYNGRTDMISIVRNSWDCKWFKHTMMERNYVAEIPAKDFNGNVMINNLMEMINFKQWIRDQINGNTSDEGGGSSFQPEQLLTSYTYTDNRFRVGIDLLPIDANLGPLTIGITHDQSYNLTTLDATVSLLDGWCTISTIEPHLQLLESEYGLATKYVNNQTYFNYFK